MPRASTKTVKSKKTPSRKRKTLVSKEAEVDVSAISPQEYLPTTTQPNSNLRFWKIGLVVLVAAAILGLIAARYKNWFIVATVNGQPILTSELNRRLSDRFGSQLLEALIGEKLIMIEAQKQNSSVTQAEIESKMAEIEKSLDGGSLADSLRLQGVSQDEFRNQLHIQLLIDKMLSKEVSISAAEVDDYLKTNATTLTATTEAEKRLEAETAIKNNKIGSLFLDWFQKLKEQAKIQRFL